MKKLLTNEIVVIGGNHHNTLAVLRSLGEKGLCVFLIVVSKETKPYVCYSKYVKKYYVVENTDSISDVLHTISEGLTEKSIIIACTDSISSYLDMHPQSDKFFIPGSKEQGGITTLMNKNTMSQLAVEAGIQIPPSWTFNNEYKDVSEVEYPCIVKPLVSKNGSKADIVICKTRAELNQYFEHCNSGEVQIQKYITKDIEFQLIGCSLNSGEQVIIPGASIILRQPENTNTGFLQYVLRRNFIFNEKVCKEFICRTGYSGLFSMEFLRDKDGNDYFMEINFRNDGNSICVTAAGMNLPYIWCLYNAGLPIDEELCYEQMKEVLVMPEFNDFSNVIHRRLSLWNWLIDVKRTDCFMEFSKRDQMPFWFYLFKSLKNKL